MVSWGTFFRYTLVLSSASQPAQCTNCALVNAQPAQSLYGLVATKPFQKGQLTAGSLSFVELHKTGRQETFRAKGPFGIVLNMTVLGGRERWGVWAWLSLGAPWPGNK